MASEVATQFEPARLVPDEFGDDLWTLNFGPQHPATHTTLRLVLEHALRFLRPGGSLVALVKPQFEAGREQVRRGGKVTDGAVHREVLAEIRANAAQLGLLIRGQTESALPGKKSGNREFFLWWEWPESGAQKSTSNS